MKKRYLTEEKSDEGNAKTQAQNESAARQLIKDKEHIKALWEKKVRNQVHSAETQTSFALQNSVEIFLNELSVALMQSNLDSSKEIGQRGMSQLHGEQRAKFIGYFLPQLLEEFSILRQVILENLHMSECLSYQAGVIINSAIDSATSLAATEFTKVQQTTIKSALEKAEMSNKELENFAAIAAHDLKSPLATISGYLDLLTDGDNEAASLNKESQKYISIAQRAAERMRNLVDRLLDYARLTETDKPFSSIDLNEIIRSVLQNLHDAIKKNHAEISYEKLPIVVGQPQLLSQVFQNLVANSIKFHGKQAPKVQIEVHAESDTYFFSFRDNGVGFDPEYKNDIFALYKKLQGEDDHQGTGIGLATCKKVIELHGGQIWAESQPDVGSIFYFTLPKPESTKAKDLMELPSARRELNE